MGVIIQLYQETQGIFFYNQHPIRQVDILGTVVLTKEQESFYIYGVDDGTGVISCMCWKNTLTEKKSLSDFESHSSTSGALDLIEQIRKMQVAVQQKTRLEIGDLVRVRGCIRIYRQQREIKAFMYYKINDPMFEVQISRMLKLPHLYRDIYDKPFHFQEEAQRRQGPADALCSITILSGKIRDFLLGKKIQSFYKQELETVEDLVRHVQSEIPSTTAGQMESEAGPSSKSIRKAFTEAIQVLQEKGVIFQKSQNPKNLFYVTEQDRELHRTTLEVLRADCKRPKYAEKGCHRRHILSCIQQSYSPYVTEAVICCLLDWLEANSDVVTTMEDYYTVF
ncbi:CST complex subunit STN1 isoform X2 [Varanus komodoensis]|uniref:CST complex subunit STN1 isoform X2 n=1 Tax=Varanus komodoensis TaxID=61221 RepID=UPI001CF76EFB|nr:CST complex subunit STN1 isoform X2 [Varanus komodoensis]